MSQGLGLNERLIGQTGSRWLLQTPALVIDLDCLEDNLKAMASHCSSANLALRPHAKTHKCAEIAQRQIDAGALGICCAKLGEAEAMAAVGISSILVTSPIVTDEGIERVWALNERMLDLMIVVDHISAAKRLADRQSDRKPLKILVDLDVGLHRTGVEPGDKAYALAEFIANNDAFEFCGLQAYAGHIMHIEDFADRRTASLACMAVLKETRDALVERGLPPRICSGGGTGTFNIDGDADVLTELQGGSYIFMDRQYNDVKNQSGDPWLFKTALFVHTSVISSNTSGIVTLDAGFKSFATDADAPILHAGAPDGAEYFFFGDEQGGVMFADKVQSLPPGHQLACVTPHCDPTVNLYDYFHCVRGDDLVDIWPITARGCSY